MAELLNSRKNKLITKLLEGRRGKGEWGELLFPEGIRLCEEVMRADLRVEACFFAASLGENLARTFGDAETKYYVVSDDLFKQISETKTPQGILLVCEKPKAFSFRDVEEQAFSMVVLESVQDPGNVGTILRTAYALGFRAAVLTGMTADPWQGKVLRAAMGAAFHLPLLVEKDRSQVIRWSKEYNIAVLASALDGLPIRAYKPEQKVGLWVGNEGRGLSEAALAAATVKLTIPMPGGAESLNASTAAAIMMYELQQNRLDSTSEGHSEPSKN